MIEREGSKQPETDAAELRERYEETKMFYSE